MRPLSILLCLLLSLTATAGAQTAADNALDPLVRGRHRAEHHLPSR